MQNPYSKLFFGIKFLFVIRFPNGLLHILQQTYGLMLATKFLVLFINKFIK